MTIDIEILQFLHYHPLANREEILGDVPNTVTLSAMNEAESGHDAGVVCMDSLDTFMNSMEE